MGKLDLSRRSFLKASVLAGVSVYIAPMGSRAFAALFEDKILTPVQWDAANGQAKFRIDGIAKVTGSKVFARDIRATDMPHWPQQQSHAFILRTTQADRSYEGFDLSLLGDDLKPDRVVTAEDLTRDGLIFPAFYGDDMLLPPGKTPAYLGQAVAILIYHDFARFRFAKDKLKFQDQIIRYGAQTGPLERDPWGTFRFVRVGGKTPYDDDIFSSLKDAPVFPSMMRKHQPVWPDGVEHGKLDEQGMFHAGQIQQELDHPSADWLVMEREYTTQSIDTAALEPDNANCWYDAATQSLHMVVPTQAPLEVVESAAGMVAKCAFPVKNLFIHPCYTVGYGSKDHFNVPFYGLVCAMYADGRPVRLANDRYEQFQTSLKRHAFKMNYRIAVDKNTGLLQSFTAAMQADGGGRCNFSPSVAMVGATAAQSIYYFPKNDLSAVAIASRAIDAGSARGYGTLQSMAATEMMVDEIAAQLNVDPIDFRLKNALRSGMKNTQGAVPAGAIRVDDVLEKAKVHPLWVNRAKRKAEFEAAHPGKRYGVGFACVQKDFGTGAETSFAKVEFSAERQDQLATYGCRNRHRHVDLAGRRGREVARQTGHRRACRHHRLARSAGRHERRSVHDVASGAGQARGEPALVAGLCVAVERDELGVLLHAQHARSCTRRVRAWLVAGGAGDLASRRRWRAGRAAGGAHRRGALGRRQAVRGGPRSAAIRTAREEGARVGSGNRRDGARVQSLAMD